MNATQPNAEVNSPVIPMTDRSLTLLSLLTESLKLDAKERAIAKECLDAGCNLKEIEEFIGLHRRTHPKPRFPRLSGLKEDLREGVHAFRANRQIRRDSRDASIH